MKSLILGLAMLAAMPAMAAELITKPSPHSVDETANRLEAAIANAGATLFARVDHAAGAERVGLELRPTTMVMFGNPKLGSPVMQMAQSAGLDLPQRVVIWQGEDGSVSLTYRDPSAFSEEHGLPEGAEELGRVRGALDNLTNAAVAAE